MHHALVALAAEAVETGAVAMKPASSYDANVTDRLQQLSTSNTLVSDEDAQRSRNRTGFPTIMSSSLGGH